MLASKIPFNCVTRLVFMGRDRDSYSKLDMLLSNTVMVVLNGIYCWIWHSADLFHFSVTAIRFSKHSNSTVPTTNGVADFESL